MKVGVDYAASGRCAESALVARTAISCGLHLLDETGVNAAHALAERALGKGVASADTFNAIQRHVSAAVFGVHEGSALSGVLASFPLNRLGHERLMAGRFDTISVDLAGVARDGETPAAYYGWGFVGATLRAGRMVVRASAVIHRRHFWAIPTYARAVTAEGRRAVALIGFRPTGWGDGSLHFIAARNPAREVAA
jgi:hypothetical protein